MNGKRLQILVTAAVLLIGIVVGSLFLTSRHDSGIVDIQNLNKCTQDIDKTRAKEVESKLYSLVKSANDYNKRSTADYYKATVRDGSCVQRDVANSRDSEGINHSINTSTLIVDIADAKQSWKITFDWIKTGESRKNIDLGTITPECLAANQLKFGDFKCENIMSLTEYGTDKPDPILQYMPYTGAGFTMEFDPNTKTVTVNFDPTPDIKDIPAFIQNTKAVIPYWFQKRGLDQTKYKVVYSSDIDSADDNQQ